MWAWMEASRTVGLGQTPTAPYGRRALPTAAPQEVVCRHAASAPLPHFRPARGGSAFALARAAWPPPARPVLPGRGRGPAALCCRLLGPARCGPARPRHGLRQRHRGVLRRSRRRAPGGRLPRAVSLVRPPPCPALPSPPSERPWGRRPPPPSRSSRGAERAPPCILSSSHSGCWGSAVRGWGEMGRLDGLASPLSRRAEMSPPLAGRTRVLGRTCGGATRAGSVNPPFVTERWDFAGAQRAERASSAPGSLLLCVKQLQVHSVIGF